MTRAEELVEWKRQRAIAKNGGVPEDKDKGKWTVAFTPSKGLGEVAGRGISVLGDATNVRTTLPVKRKLDPNEPEVREDVKENAGSQVRARSSARGKLAATKETAHAAKVAKRETAKKSTKSRPASAKAGKERIDSYPERKVAAAPRQPVKSSVSAPKRRQPAAPAPPEQVARLEALAKKLPAERNEKWKLDCEALMKVDNLHSASMFWVVRSQYAELLRPRSEQAIKAVITPIVLGLEGGAEPQEPLQRRALRLVQKLHGPWKNVGHAREMAGQLQNALRKKFKAGAYASAVAPSGTVKLAKHDPATPGKWGVTGLPFTPRASKVGMGVVQEEPASSVGTPRAGSSGAKTPRCLLTPRVKSQFDVLDMGDGSPEAGCEELEHLYDGADWTEPEQDTWANAKEADPADVAAAEEALEAAVVSRIPGRLANAILFAEQKNVVSEAVDVAKHVLVAVMCDETGDHGSDVGDDLENKDPEA